MSKIILATGNLGKVQEFQRILTDCALEIIPQSHFNVTSIPETGLTFVENALLKARHAALQTGLPALADDSGVIVDALKGAPGIYSARYGGENATAEQNIQKLLSALQEVPEAERTARFYCVLTLLRHPEDPLPIIAEGIWEGKILLAPQGSEGFGYDPIFWVPEHQCSAAQLPEALKNCLSHRGQAMQNLLQKLRLCKLD